MVCLKWVCMFSQIPIQDYVNLYRSRRYRIETGFAGMNAAHYLHCELSRGVGIPQKQNVVVESLSRKVHCTLQ